MANYNCTGSNYQATDDRATFYIALPTRDTHFSRLKNNTKKTVTRDYPLGTSDVVSKINTMLFSSGNFHESPMYEGRIFITQVSKYELYMYT